MAKPTVKVKAKVEKVLDTSNSPTDPACCPLCGQANSCSNTVVEDSSSIGSDGTGSAKSGAKSQSCSGDSATDCWCYNSDIRFPAELIKQIPKAQQRQVCICRRCAEKYSDSAL